MTRRQKAPKSPSAPPPPARPGPPGATLSPKIGGWLWTCRAGFERHLFEELAAAGAAPRLLGDALVEAARRIEEPPVFGRMGFEVISLISGTESPAEVARSLHRAARDRPLCVQAWSVDSDQGNGQAQAAEVLGEAVRAQQPPELRIDSAAAARDQGAWLGQICLIAANQGAVGLVPAREASSLAPGGRQRMRRGAEAPSRAAMKLDEALEGLTLAPGKGDTCVDLGAAPGGWTQRLAARGARVVAIDPANLALEIGRHRLVRHVKASAFTFEPEEPVDWLCCDMAWRPLEVAQLLAKWGRRGWALHLVANIKLPMKEKNATLRRVRQTLGESWQQLKIRQLYHDRDEVTVTATVRH